MESVLVVKQVSKPISKTFADRAKTSPVFRNHVIFPLGSLVYRVQVRLKMKEMGLKGKVTKVPKLGDEKLMEMGSQVLAEILLFSMVGGFLVVAVFLCQGDGMEDQYEEEELELMRSRLERLDNMIEDQQKGLNHLETNINLLLKSLK